MRLACTSARCRLRSQNARTNAGVNANATAGFGQVWTRIPMVELAEAIADGLVENTGPRLFFE